MISMIYVVLFSNCYILIVSGVLFVLGGGYSGFLFGRGGGLYLLGFFLWMFWNFEEFTRFANTKLCLLNEIIFTNPYLHVLLLKTIH